MRTRRGPWGIWSDDVYLVRARLNEGGLWWLPELVLILTGSGGVGLDLRLPCTRTRIVRYGVLRPLVRRLTGLCWCATWPVPAEPGVYDVCGTCRRRVARP